MSFLIICFCIFALLGGLWYIISFTVESDEGWVNWNTIYRSKWLHNHRYKIAVDSTKPLLIVTVWRRYWNKLERLDAMAISQSTTVDRLYQDAHKWGQEMIAEKTEFGDKRSDIKKFGKKNARKLGKLVAVSTKLCI